MPAAAVYTAPGAGALARERASKARFSPLRRIEGIGALIACAIVAEAAGNMVFHQIVLTQARIYQHAQQYLARRRAEGRTSREARRALKRLIVRRVHRAWRACFESDVERVAA